MNVKSKGPMQRAAGIGAVLGIVSAVLYGVLSTDGENWSPVVYLCLAAGIVLDGLVLLLPSQKDLAVTLEGWAAALLCALALAFFITERVQWLFKILSKMSAAPLTALFPVTIAVFVVTILAQIVSLYLPAAKQ